MPANAFSASSHITSSILNGANVNTGIYTLLSNNETITFTVNGVSYGLNAISITAQGTALKIVPNAKESNGFIYIAANSTKLISGFEIKSIKVLNNIGATLYFEGTIA